jgi:hypothetical protein
MKSCPPKSQKMGGAGAERNGVGLNGQGGRAVLDVGVVLQTIDEGGFAGAGRPDEEHACLVQRASLLPDGAVEGEDVLGIAFQQSAWQGHGQRVAMQVNLSRR